MNFTKYLITLLPVFLAAAQSQAQNNDPLFQSAKMLEITLTAPFARIDRERDKDAQYKDATFSYTDSEGKQFVFDVELEVRGNNRLRKEICNYSQLWVNFKKGQVEGTLFDNQDKLKLVVQCKDAQRYADYIIKEQQVYQLYNQLSRYSFSSRLLRANFVDSERENESRTHFAFFIEHQDNLAKRSDMKNFELNSIQLADLDPEQSSLVSLFMYMISNTDYSIVQGPPDDECCHNTKLLETEEGKYIPLPYDFDSTGFVDTSYAEPVASLNQRSVRQRIFRGFCVPVEVLQNTLANFRQARPVISEIIGDTTHVSAREAKRSLDYIDDFYEIIDDPRKLEREIVEECRG